MYDVVVVVAEPFWISSELGSCRARAIFSPRSPRSAFLYTYFPKLSRVSSGVDNYLSCLRVRSGVRLVGF